MRPFRLCVVKSPVGREGALYLFDDMTKGTWWQRHPDHYLQIDHCWSRNTQEHDAPWVRLRGDKFTEPMTGCQVRKFLRKHGYNVTALPEGATR